MTFPTPKLELKSVDIGVPGYDTIIDDNSEDMDDAISTIEIREYGETMTAYEAVYVKSDGKYWLAQANGTLQPAFGIAIDTGVATDEKRVRTAGLMENGSWSWTNIGGYIYLDPSTPGALTETAPSANTQIIGVILSATEIFVYPSGVYQSAAVLTASYAANQTLTALECNGYVIYVTGAATITLPPIAVGMSVTIITIGAVAVSVDPDASDKIWLDGTALDDGDKITNLSTAGDIAVLTYYSGDGWYASTNSWTDGGA